ncbi:MAG: Fic family protein [Paracoccaceae bacterium]
MKEAGAELVIAAPDALAAGFDQARLVAEDEPDASPFHLTALMFEGIATRQSLVDGNKRLAWLAAVVFLDLNGWYLDAPERAAFEAGMAVIRGENGTDTLAAFFDAHALADA